MSFVISWFIFLTVGVFDMVWARICGSLILRELVSDLEFRRCPAIPYWLVGVLTSEVTYGYPGSSGDGTSSIWLFVCRVSISGNFPTA